MDDTLISKRPNYLRILLWPYFPFLVLGIVIFIIHLFMKAGVSDDSWFIQTFNAPGFDPVSYSIARYQQWTSRTVLELIQIVFIRMPIIFWKLLDTVFYVTIGIFISKIFVGRQRRLEANTAIACFMLLFPYNYLSSAGWVTATINYLWPLMFGLISIYPLRKISDGIKIRYWEYIIYAISLLIAANQEQMCFVILVVYCAFVIYMLIRKKINAFLLVQFVLCLISLIYILLCPGNAARYSQETTKWFPEYITFSFIQKTELGISALLSTLFLSGNRLFLAFSFIVFYLVCKKYRCLFYRFVASVPLFSLIALNTLYPLAKDNGHLKAFFNMAQPYGMINSGVFGTTCSLLIVFLMLFIICCLIISLYMLSDKDNGSLIVIRLFIIGCATKAMIGFSPTVWASSDRTGIFLLFSLIACSSCLLNKWDYSNSGVNRIMFIFVIMLGVSGGVYNLITT